MKLEICHKKETFILWDPIVKLEICHKKETFTLGSNDETRNLP